MPDKNRATAGGLVLAGRSELVGNLSKMRGLRSNESRPKKQEEALREWFPRGQKDG
jgi:hypothetical protein